MLCDGRKLGVDGLDTSAQRTGFSNLLGVTFKSAVDQRGYLALHVTRSLGVRECLVSSGLLQAVRVLNGKT